MRTFINIIAASALGGLSLSVAAGVKSLSSDEMVDTYIKDSAIIVVPKKQEESAEEKASKERARRSLTISPGEPIVSESEEQQIQGNQRDVKNSDLKTATTFSNEQRIRDTLLMPLEEVARSQPDENFAPQRPLVLVDGQPLQIPDGPFTQTFLNNELGLNYDGSKLTFSIGNPSGIDQIQIPEAIRNGPIDLTPRPGGGFDLSIQVPQN